MFTLTRGFIERHNYDALHFVSCDFFMYHAANFPVGLGGGLYQKKFSLDCDACSNLCVCVH